MYICVLIVYTNLIDRYSNFLLLKTDKLCKSMSLFPTNSNLKYAFTNNLKK